MCNVLVIEDGPLIADYVADLASMAGATSVAVAISEAESMEAAAILSKPITADHVVCEFRKVAPAPSGAKQGADRAGAFKASASEQLWSSLGIVGSFRESGSLG